MVEISTFTKERSIPSFLGCKIKCLIIQRYGKRSELQTYIEYWERSNRSMRFSISFVTKDENKTRWIDSGERRNQSLINRGKCDYVGAKAPSSSPLLCCRSHPPFVAASDRSSSSRPTTTRSIALPARGMHRTEIIRGSQTASSWCILPAPSWRSSKRGSDDSGNMTIEFHE
jgi:hypothetical protein